MKKKTKMIISRKRKSKGIKHMNLTNSVVTTGNVFDEVIEMSRLTGLEEKFLNYAIHKINKDDIKNRLVIKEQTGAKEIDFTTPYTNKRLKLPVIEFAKIIGNDSGRIFKDLDRICKSLVRKIVITDSPIKTSYFLWLSYIDFLKEKAEIEFCFSDRALPLVTSLAGNYTSVMLTTILGFSSSYAMRIYRLLIQRKKYENRKINFELLKGHLGLVDTKSYKILTHFRLKVLDPSKKEINEKSDINMNYKIEKEDAKIFIYFTFKVKTKQESIKKQLEAPVERYKREMEENKQNKTNEIEPCLNKSTPSTPLRSAVK